MSAARNIPGQRPSLEIQPDCSDEGSGDAVVLIHGGASNNRQWKSLIADLKPYFRVIAPNMHGAGKTPSWQGPNPYRLADAAALIERRGATRPRLARGDRTGPSIEDYKSLRMPTTLVRGEKSHPISRLISERLHELIQASNLVEIPAASHFMIHTHAVECAKIIGADRASRQFSNPSPAR